MKKSEFETIAELAETYNTIPVCREIYADVITPISLLRRLAAVSKRFYLLESVEGGEKWGRYSFLGFDPVLRAVCRDGTVRLEGLYNETIPTENPMQVLRNILQEYHSPEMNDLPPFTGGFVGYFAYAMIGYAAVSYTHLSRGGTVVPDPAGGESAYQAVGERFKYKNI